MLLTKVARSREAELEASGRASALERMVDAQRDQLAVVNQQNTMLLQRLLGGGATPPPMELPVTMTGLPPIMGGVPLGSPRRPNGQAPIGLGDVGLPVPPSRHAEPPKSGYDLGGLETEISFQDMGDDEAAKQGITNDDETGALVGGSAPAARK